MRTVKVDRVDLLDKVKANRDKHREIFLKAQDGYRKKFIEVVEERLADARSGRHIDQHIGLIEPMDQTKEYDRVISMLEMSLDDEIELTANEYAAYVMDDWAWKRQWVESNTVYTDAL